MSRRRLGVKPPRACHICGKEYKSAFNLNYHIAHHSEDRPFICIFPDCHNAYKTNADLKQHQKSHEKSLNMTFICAVCNFAFDSSTKLNVHKRKNHSNLNKLKETWCEICKKNFSSLPTHRKEVHLRIRRFVCDIDGKKFAKRSGVVRHIESVHLDLKLFSCKKCEKNFSDSSSLLRHHRYHARLKKDKVVKKISKLDHVSDDEEVFTIKSSGFKCGCCKKCFRTKSSLNDHEKTDHPQAALVCDQCAQRFITKARLTRHVINTHQENEKTERKIKCGICKRIMKNKWKLERHKRQVHFNISDFLCNFCPTTFKDKRSLANHLSNKHNQKDVSRSLKCSVCEKVLPTLYKFENHEIKCRLKQQEDLNRELDEQKLKSQNFILFSDKHETTIKSFAGIEEGRDYENITIKEEALDSDSNVDPISWRTESDKIIMQSDDKTTAAPYFAIVEVNIKAEMSPSDNESSLNDIFDGDPYYSWSDKIPSSKALTCASKKRLADERSPTKRKINSSAKPSTEKVVKQHSKKNPKKSLKLTQQHGDRIKKRDKREPSVSSHTSLEDETSGEKQNKTLKCSSSQDSEETERLQKEKDEIMKIIQSIKDPKERRKKLECMRKRQWRSRQNPKSLENTRKKSMEYHRTKRSQTDAKSFKMLMEKSDKSVGNKRKKAFEGIKINRETVDTKMDPIGDNIPTAIVDKWRFRCKQCPRICGSSSGLKSHMKTHSKAVKLLGEVTEFRCSQCPRVCTNSTGLKLHLLTHEKLDDDTEGEPENINEDNLKLAFLKGTLNDSSKMFVCSICQREFPTINPLNEHCVREHRIKRYKCLKCNHSFSRRSIFDRHFQCKHSRSSSTTDFFYRDYPIKDESAQCPRCPEIFTNYKSLRAHIQLCHGDLRTDYMCELCGKSFNDLQAYAQHDLVDHATEGEGKKVLIEQLISKGKAKQCTDCGSTVIGKNALRDHQWSQHLRISCTKIDRKIKLECMICKESFKTNNSARRHYSQAHANGLKQLRICGECNSGFELWNDFQLHVKFTHVDGNICMTCGDSFATAHQLLLHSKIHRYLDEHEKKLCCDLCEFRAAQKVTLISHMIKVHKASKTKYQATCERCGRVFTSHSSFYQHKRFHEMSKDSFACKYCKKIYVTHQALRSHEKIHECLPVRFS